MLKILAAPLIKEKKTHFQNQVSQLFEMGCTPHLAVVLVGDHGPSLTYVGHKKRFCEEIGAQCSIIRLPQDIEENSFLQKIAELNDDEGIHGIIVQLPLPKHLQHLKNYTLVKAAKDVDGFHLENMGAILNGTGDEGFIPCTPKGVMELLRFYEIDPRGKNAVVIGRSAIVGRPLSMLLTNAHATTTLCHSQTPEISHFTKNAEIIVVAIGKAHWLTQEYIGDTKPYIIDVGINYLNGKLVGDCDVESLKKKNISGYTPVPGGVGPMTVCSLMENLIVATKRQKGITP